MAASSREDPAFAAYSSSFDLSAKKDRDDTRVG
jgi:hypothetical protein